MLGRVGAAAGGEAVEVGEGEDVLEAAGFAAHLVDLRELLVVLDENAHRLRVLEDVRASCGELA